MKVNKARVALNSVKNYMNPNWIGIKSLEEAIDERDELINALFEILAKYNLDKLEEEKLTYYNLEIVGTDYNYAISKETYDTIKKFEGRYEQDNKK